MCFDSPFDLLFPGSEVQEGLQENEEAVSLHYLREPPRVLKCKKSPFHIPTLLLQSNSAIINDRLKGQKVYFELLLVTLS